LCFNYIFQYIITYHVNHLHKPINVERFSHHFI